MELKRTGHWDKIASMQNPWTSLPFKTPFLLKCDADVVHKFNSQTHSKHKLKLEYFPEPFLGNPTLAKVILLNKNPGIDEANRVYHNSKEYINKAKINLKHGQQKIPFFLLSEDLKHTPGGKWWNKKLGQLISDSSVEKVGNGIACIEIHGYPSKSYKHIHNLKSMLYSEYLVEQAIKRKAVIVLMRGFSCWHELVPSLNRYKQKMYINSVQNPCITPNNFCNLNYYQQIIDLIK